MKHLYSSALVAVLLLFTAFSGQAQSDLILTGVMDGDLPGGTPKAIELYAVNDIADLSVYGVAMGANASAPPAAPTYNFPADAVAAGSYIYLTANETEFNTMFGFNADYVASVLTQNGDDKIHLYLDGAHVDGYGDPTADGTGTPWEYVDGWAYRVDGTGPNTTFDVTEWIVSNGGFDGSTSNDDAPNPMPIGTYSPEAGSSEEVTIMEIQTPTDETGNSPYLNQLVITSGVVTASYDEGFWIQDGTGPWSGVFVSSEDLTAAVGDNVIVSGTVAESYGLTTVGAVTDVTINSSGNELPAPTIVSTADAGTEQYESVLIKVENALYAGDPINFGEWKVNDGSGTLVVDNELFSYTPADFTTYNITGVGYYSFNEFKIAPRDADDIEVIGSETGVSFEVAEMSVDESAGTVTASVVITNPTATETSVDVVVTGGTAVAGTDYNFGTVTLTFPANSTEAQTFSFDVLDNTEENEDVTIEFSLQNPTNDALIGIETLTVTIEDNDGVITITPIGTVIEMDADFVPVHLDEEFTITGITYGSNLAAPGIQFNLIDETGAIVIYNSGETVDGYTVAEGDSLVVTGVVTFFNGLTEFEPSSIELISSGHELNEPMVVTSFSEEMESHLLMLECVYLTDPAEWTGTGSGFNVTVTNGTDEFQVRIDNGVDLYSQPAPTGTFNITGLLGQYDSSAPHDTGYQLFPRYVADIEQTECGTGAPPDNNTCGAGADINSLFAGAINEEMASGIYSNENATSTDTDPETGFECFGEPDGGGSAPSLESTVWFSFTGTGETYYIKTTNCSGTVENYIPDGDTQMAIYSGLCGSTLLFTAEECNEDMDDAPDGEYPAGMLFETVEGTQYHLMIDGFAGIQGEFCLSVTKVEGIGVGETNVAGFNMFPNPAQNEINIHSAERLTEVKITNVIGQTVKVVSGTDVAAQPVSIDGLSQGVYFVTIRNASNHAGTQRLVVE